MGSPPSAGHTTPWPRPGRGRVLWPEARSSESAVPRSHPCTTGTAAPEPKRSDDPPHAPWFVPPTHGASAYPRSRSRRIPRRLHQPEFVSGTPILLGTDRTPHECFIQVPGTGLRIGTDDLRRAVTASVSLQQHLLRYVQALTLQTAQTALANGCCKVEERLARWLLMCHDRVDGDGLSTTHEFLSVMLGVRRTGVTEMLKVFDDRGLISTQRGQVTVLDRVGLEGVAGDSYGVPEAEYSRLIGLPLGFA